MIISDKLKALLLVSAISFGAPALTQAQGLKTPVPSTLQKVSQGFALSEINIEYSRPSAKGRTIFGDLVPYDKLWRTGANQSTKFTFGEDVQVAGKDLKAGTYAVYTIPGQNEWKVLFYSDLKLGGNVAGYDKSKEVLSITVPAKKTAESVETFTISVANVTNTTADIDITWANTKVTIPVSTSIDEKVMASIQDAMKDNKPYFQAAMYYFENGKDLKQAYDWIQKAAEANPNAFWILLNKAKIEHALGKHEEAIASATSCKVKATESKNDDYVKMADQLIEHCREELKKQGGTKKK